MHENGNREPTSILDLPDEILELILSHLNQINLTKVNLVNSRLYKLSNKKLHRQIYVNIEKPRIEIARDLCTAFYIKYTVVNKLLRSKTKIFSLNMKHTRKI
ncbi:hypothetical protein JA1_000187 [Spathaspora sp. JA1]|nr:hypothetical protein JA1_000187 [Spathaspora sp. JA1]